jgi:NAD-dependent dihydropyrimidine dehydrogenase PreA subunit
MMYVDRNLCSGCGLCVDACESGAIAVLERSAAIDLRLCADCGRCAAICMTGAIQEVLPAELPGLPVRSAGAPATPAERAAQPAPLPARTARPPSLFAELYAASRSAKSDLTWPPSKLSRGAADSSSASSVETVERLMSGVFGLLNLVLDHRRGKVQPGNACLSQGRAGRGGRRPDGRGQGLGRAGRRQNNRCRAGD